MYYLKHKQSQERIAGSFTTIGEAEARLDKLGLVIAGFYEIAVEDTGSPKTNRMLLEGLVKGDLYKILIPRISVDEFVPGDPDTDNVVIAFFLKGVPEATLPFKTFAEKSNGVISADYGDSETVVGAQNVYVEFDRDNLEMEDIHALMIQAAMLAGLEVDDFTMTFPHTDQKFPYDPKAMKEYFISRDRKKNEIAQRKAIDAAAKEFEDTLRQAQEKKQADQQAQEQPAPDNTGQGLEAGPENTGQGLGGGDTGSENIEQDLQQWMNQFSHGLLAG